VQALVDIVRGPLPENRDPQPKRIALFSLGNMAGHAGLRAELQRVGCPAEAQALLASSDSTMRKYSERILKKLRDAGS